MCVYICMRECARVLDAHCVTHIHTRTLYVVQCACVYVCMYMHNKGNCQILFRGK